MHANRNTTKLVIALVAILLAPSAYAGQVESETWFNGLSASVRTMLQDELILLGQYDALADGTFGPATFSAIKSYQAAKGMTVSGVLSTSDLDGMSTEAKEKYEALGLEVVTEDRAGLELAVPGKLLPERQDQQIGARYSSGNGAIELTTARIPGKALSALFQETSVDSPSQTVSYAASGAASFSVSGVSGSEHFYERFYADGLDAVGFVLKWQKASDEDGKILAAFIASHSSPVAGLPQAATSARDFESQHNTPTSNIVGGAAPAVANSTSLVPLKPDGGTFVVPVLVNGAITLDFTLDSGAADVAVPADVVLTLMRAGTITKDDFLGSQTYTLANGQSVPSQTLMLHSLVVGQTIVHNVRASVAPVDGMLLLGQSFLGQLNSWSIDNATHTLVVGTAATTGGGLSPQPLPSTAPSVADTGPSAPAGTTRLAIYGGLDFYGNDIFKGRTADSAACATHCQDNSQCKAFTFNANPTIRSGPNCFLKGGTSRVEAYSTAISGLFLEPEDGDAKSYSFDAIDPTADLMLNQDLLGNDLSKYPYSPARTLDTCRMACIDNSACVAFSFASSAKQCWLKGTAGMPSTARGIVSGVKHTVSISPAKVFSLSR